MVFYKKYIILHVTKLLRSTGDFLRKQDSGRPHAPMKLQIWFWVKKPNHRHTAQLVIFHVIGTSWVATSCSSTALKRRRSASTTVSWRPKTTSSSLETSSSVDKLTYYDEPLARGHVDCLSVVCQSLIRLSRARIDKKLKQKVWGQDQKVNMSLPILRIPSNPASPPLFSSIRFSTSSSFFLFAPLDMPRSQ